MKISIDNFIYCVYDADKEVCSISISDTQTIPPNQHNLAEWHFKKQDIEDAIRCKWLLFEGHDEVWMPIYDENGQRGEALIINAEYADNGQLTHAKFNQQRSNFTLNANARIVQIIHKFWKDIVYPYMGSP